MRPTRLDTKPAPGPFNLVLYVPTALLDLILDEQRMANEVGAEFCDTPNLRLDITMRVKAATSHMQAPEDELSASMPVIVRPGQEMPSFAGGDGVLGECLRLLVIGRQRRRSRKEAELSRQGGHR